MHCVAIGETQFGRVNVPTLKISLKEKSYGKGFCSMAPRYSVWLDRYTLAVWFPELASSH